MSIERRRHLRVLMPWVMEVVYQIKTKAYRRTVLDLSIGGMFIQSRHCPPDNCELKLSFELDGKPVACRARVVHSRSEVGFGILFLDLAETDREYIRAVVQRVAELVSVA